MVYKVKNERLRKKTMKRTNKYDDRAIAAYQKGDMKTGKLYEDKSTKLYAKNYYKFMKRTLGEKKR